MSGLKIKHFSFLFSEQRALACASSRRSMCREAVWNRHTKTSKSLIVAMLAGLAMCVMTDAASAEVLSLAAELTGTCTGSGSPSKGWATFELDTDTGSLTYRIDFDPEVVPFQAHIHVLPNACGNIPSGQIIFFFGLVSPVIGSTTLAVDDVQSMIENATYVNLHTGEFPDGEIAGVIYPVPTNRYLSLSPIALTAPSLASTQAIRVTLVSLHHPNPPTPGSPDFSASEGQFQWIGAPEVLSESSGPNTTFTRVALQCTPEFRDWSDVPFLLHAMGPDVVPSSAYAVQYVDDTCADLGDPSCYSDPIIINTSRYGDVIAPFSKFTGGGQPNFGDINQLVAKFQGAPSAMVMPRADLRGPGMPAMPNSPDGSCNFSDINADVGAFQGNPYPFGPGPICP